jgi:tight adherence protein B
MNWESESLLLLYKIGTLVGAGTLFFIVFLINSKKITGYVDKKFSDQADWLVKELDTLFIEINRRTALVIIYAGTLGVGFIVFLLFMPKVIPGLLVGGALGFSFSKMPQPIIRMLKTKRAAKFNLQMVDALTLMSNALRSGLTLVQASELVVQEMPDPIRQEFNLLLAQNRIGVPIDEAFANLSERLELEDLSMFATAILILRETGGNLAETFDTVVYIIRERVKLSAKIMALTAQGITQAIVLILIPFVLLVVQYFGSPDTVGLLFTTPLGYVFLSAMFILQGVGGIFIKKIVTIKV